MRIIVDTNALNAALSIVTKALPVRSTISVLEGVYMKAEQRRLLLRCTDLNIQIEASIDTLIEKEGATVLPGRLFSEMAKRLPGDRRKQEEHRGDNQRRIPHHPSMRGCGRLPRHERS